MDSVWNDNEWKTLTLNKNYKLQWNVVLEATKEWNERWGGDKLMSWSLPVQQSGN